MALLEITTNLFDQLISSVTGVSIQKDAAKFRSLQRSMHPILNSSRSARINNQAVNDQLDGLQEKFRILNYDELADALQQRLRELSGNSKTWTPELLLFLLQLSDNPATETRLEDLDLLKLPPSSPALTWAQIVADDPLEDDEGIWQNVDFESGSSEDDEDLTPDLSPSIRPRSISSATDGPTAASPVKDLEAPTDQELLRKIVEAHFCKPEKGSNEPVEQSGFLTEMKFVREVLFMLLGLPTVLYELGNSGQVESSSKYSIQQTSNAALRHILESFASIGQGLAILRGWAHSLQVVPIIQTFQAGLLEKLQAFDIVLSGIEMDILNPANRRPITLLYLHEQVHKATRFLLLLVPVFERSQRLADRPFEILEALYGLVCASESRMDHGAHSFFTDLFFLCFKTYIKPLRMWMEIGELDEDDHVFFVKKNKTDPALTDLWSDQYKILRDAKGVLHGPRFLDMTAQKIFNSGRSVNFLHSLDLREIKYEASPLHEPPLEFRAAFEREQVDELSPFSATFGTIFEKWIAAKYRSSSLNLREVIGHRCGLWSSLDALEYIYFPRNGALTCEVASAISSSLDEHTCNWMDRFVLTELFRRVYGQLDCVNAGQLVINTTVSMVDEQKWRRRTMDCLRSIRITYKLPWAVTNVIKPGSLDIYQSIAVMMLQVLRAKQLLERKLPASYNEKSQKFGVIVAMICSLRHRQLWFLNEIYSYFTTVLSRTSSTMKQAMEDAADFDEMIAVHENCIKSIENQCLLSQSLESTHQAMISLLDLTIVFSDLCDSLSIGISTKDRRVHALHGSSRSASSEADDADTAEDRVHDAKDGEIMKRLAKMSLTFNRLLGFVLAGLREASRSGVEPSWATLVDSLATWDRS